MKNKPKIHFWREFICNHDPDTGEPVIAIHACRAWDVPANGVFMLFFGIEVRRGWKPKEGYVSKVDFEKLLTEKLEARERALINWYGRHARHHLDQFELTPREKRDLAASRAAQHERGNAGADF